MFHQLKTTKDHGKHSQNISFLFFGDRHFNLFSGTLLSSLSHETALFFKWRFLQALFRYFIQSTRHFHLLLFRYHRIIGLYFEYLYNFFGKAASVAKIQFVSFWRAAAPLKAGKPIRLFSLVTNFAFGLWLVRRLLPTCVKNCSTNQNLCCLLF